MGKAIKGIGQCIEPGEEQIDHAVEDSFPASDPPSVGGTTRIEPDENEGESGKDDGSQAGSGHR
jgi:hypothetical protein